MGRWYEAAWAALLRAEGGGAIAAGKASMPAGRLDAGPVNSAIYLLYATGRGRPMRTVSLLTAYRKFPRLVRAVERALGFPITRHGRPVARLVPHGAGSPPTLNVRRPIGA